MEMQPIIYYTYEKRKRKPALRFDIKDEATSNVCLIIKEQKFYCSKQHLSYHSEYFRKMFTSNFTEKNKNEITLKDLQAPEDFQIFLEIINGVENNISEENVNGLLFISTVWLAPMIRQRIVKYLLNAHKPVRELMTLARQFNMPELMVKAIESIPNAKEFSLAVPADLTTLDEATKTELLKKSLQLFGYPNAYLRSGSKNSESSHSFSPPTSPPAARQQLEPYSWAHPVVYVYNQGEQDQQENQMDYWQNQNGYYAYFYPSFQQMNYGVQQEAYYPPQQQQQRVGNGQLRADAPQFHPRAQGAQNNQVGVQ